MKYLGPRFAARPGGGRARSSLLANVVGHLNGFADGVRNRPFSNGSLPPHYRLVLVRRSMNFDAGYANGFGSGLLVWQAARDTALRRG